MDSTAARSTASIKRLLTSSLGEEKATKVIDRIVDETPKGLDSLQLLEAKEIAEFIGREHPQVIAVVLAGMDAKKASEVINLLPVRLATDIVARIARMAEIPQNTIEELDEIMQQKFSHTPVSKVMPIGGVRSAAGILNGVGKEIEKQIIETLNENNAVLCQEIQDNMFVFDNLIDVDDRGIQALVREVTSDMLVIALKGADQDAAGQDLQEHVEARRRNAQVGSRGQGPGAAGGGRGGTEGNRHGGPAPG